MKILHAKSIFVGVQVWELAPHLIAFHFVGAFENNPLVARLAAILGPTCGVWCSKPIAWLIGLRLQKVVWVVNLFYIGLVSWNTFILIARSRARH